MDLEQEVTRLKSEIRQKYSEIEHLNRKLQELIERMSTVDNITPEDITNQRKPVKTDGLDKESVRRYGRQLILPELGVKGQLRLMDSSVLIVGAGGLGCPAAIYLAAAGVGKLGIVDYDEVELSNLHRQILHTESRVAVTKSASISMACNQLNSQVTCVPYHLQLNSSNALQIIGQYDIVVDATDNVATRYLLNDACVLTRKPLVSGSALRFEGQLTVYNHKGGPCYRCLFPNPPPPETVTNCSDGGVLGVVPGVIGCLQALEVIKIIINSENSYRQRLLLFDALDGVFRTIRLRGRQPTCAVCGDSPSITKLIDYEEFCGARANDKDKELQVLLPKNRITAKEYQCMLLEKTPHLLIDVRPPGELEICQLPQPVINIPFDRLQSSSKDKVICLQKQAEEFQQQHGSPMTVVMVCRRGNDSQMAVQWWHEKLRNSPVVFKDIIGGLTAWAKNIDSEFHIY